MKRIVKIYYGHISTSTIDANKHPELQIQDLISLLKNSTSDVEIFCNSPYVLFYLTLIHAWVNSPIPLDQSPYPDIAPFDNQHFEVKENGDAIEGSYYKGMISDENILNNIIMESNDKFSEFLDAEEKYLKNV